jgi:hypothetical protein
MEEGLATIAFRAEFEPKLAELRARLALFDQMREALAAVVRDVNDYEDANKLSPNPGRSECWDSVARAKAVLARIDAMEKGEGK